MGELNRVFSTVDARDRLLEAALACFAERGFSGTTIREISQRAEVSQGLIAHHFGDKERLWDFVGERVTADYREWLSPILKRSEIDADTVPSILAGYLDYWRRHPSALRLQLWRLLGAPEAERLKRATDLNALVVPIFEQAQQAGYIRDDIPAGQLMVTAGSFIQYRLHSELEFRSALAVTGSSLPDDEHLIAYVYGLIARR